MHPGKFIIKIHILLIFFEGGGGLFGSEAPVGSPELQR